MATQNPIESEGTYPLPEAQVDRFMMKVLVDYPDFGEEVTVVHRSLGDAPPVDRPGVGTAAGLPGRRHQRLRRPTGAEYAVAL